MFLNRLALTLLVASSTMSSAANLRSLQDGNHNEDDSACTIMVGNELRLNPDDESSDEFFHCELPPKHANGKNNMVVNMKLDPEQRMDLLEKFRKGELVPGVSTTQIGRGSMIQNGNLEFLPGQKIAVGNRPTKDRRRLATHVGNKPILVVKVTDSNGRARPESVDQISDDVFGTFGDPVNLRSQMFDCSFTKLDISAGNPSVEDPTKVFNGVTEVTIPITLDSGSDTTIRNAVTTAVQEYLDIESLPGPYEHVMYVLEGCYRSCGWAAYAYINDWNSVYQGQYYAMTAIQMHELGHNFGFAHSGGLDGNTYTDHTGLMGTPLYSDDIGKMCWNAAKTWQVGWYDDRKDTIDPRVDAISTRRIVGIANYDKNPNEYPVVIKIETGTSTDQFIAFNRATGVNKDNDEADDEVTVVQTGRNGESYSQSYLKAHLLQGESHTFTNWQATGKDLVITANVINISEYPGYADISVTLG